MFLKHIHMFLKHIHMFLKHIHMFLNTFICYWNTFIITRGKRSLFYLCVLNILFPRPARAAMLTGRLPIRNGFYTDNERGRNGNKPVWEQDGLPWCSFSVIIAAFPTQFFVQIFCEYSCRIPMENTWIFFPAEKCMNNCPLKSVVWFFKYSKGYFGQF
jgi:hypothetical protein